MGEKKIFAPANIRAAAENKAYAELIQHWMASKYTLRYTGGMVPDIHHILVKVQCLLMDRPWQCARQNAGSRLGILDTIDTIQNEKYIMQKLIL